MKKIGIILVLLSLIGISFLGWKYFENNTTNEEIVNLEEELKEIEDDEENRERIKKKIENLKKKIKLKGMISNANMYLDKNEHMFALIEYQKILKKIPNDEEINSKVGDIYYKINKFKKANQYYSKVKKYKKLDKDKAIMSFINEKGVTKENLKLLKEEINSYDISVEKKFYYMNSISCIEDYSLCRDNFQKFFEQKKDLETEEMKNIYKALENFKNFKIENDLYYKASFVTGAFFENGFYYVALKTSEIILEQKNDYKPIMKIAAKSAYEIGDYILAKKYLINIKKIDNSDSEISYFLARVYERLNDNNLAFVNYKKAIIDGYKDIADIKRRIVILFFEANEDKKMLKAFDDLLSSDKKFLIEDDYELAIYYNILNGDYEKAEHYSKIAKNDFPENIIFPAYLSWLILQKENITEDELGEIKDIINDSLSKNKENPMINMVDGIYELKTKNYNKAILKLKNAYRLDKSGEFREAINFWLDKVKEERNNNSLQ